MLESLKKRPGSLRWPPRQRFLATDNGRAARVRYGEAIERYQSEGSQGRDELEKVQQAWAEEFHVQPADAVVLGEFGEKPLLPREAQKGLEDCGLSVADVQAAIDRLYTAGLVAPAGGGGPLPQGGSKAGGAGDPSAVS